MHGYETKHEHIAIAGVAGLRIRSLLDRRQFSDPLQLARRAGISSAGWPLFGLLWPSGALLAARLGARNVQPGERILEIGCGLALASLVGHRGGADVTASDHHPLAAGFLLENLRLNQLAPMKYRHGPWDSAAPGALQGRYDLIIGSDLLYEPDASGVLAGFIHRHAAAGGEVWIVDPNRANRPAFNRRMASGGFVLHEERLDRLGLPGLPAYKGRLLVYRREAGGVGAA